MVIVKNGQLHSEWCSHRAVGGALRSGVPLDREVRHASLLGALGSRRLRRRVIDDVDPTAASSLSYVGESPYHHNWTAARLGRQRKRESAPTNGNLAHRSIPRFRQNNLLDSVRGQQSFVRGANRLFAARL